MLVVKKILPNQHLLASVITCGHIKCVFGQIYYLITYMASEFSEKMKCFVYLGSNTETCWQTAFLTYHQSVDFVGIFCKNLGFNLRSRFRITKNYLLGINENFETFIL